MALIEVCGHLVTDRMPQHDEHRDGGEPKHRQVPSRLQRPVRGMQGHHLVDNPSASNFIQRAVLLTAERRGRYGVSLIACVLRWLEYTSRRSMLEVARDGFALYASSSKPAYKSGLFIRTRKAPPYEIPTNSLIARSGQHSPGRR